MKAGIEMVRTFSSFVLSMIAPNTPVCVKHGRIAAERIVELPFVATSKIARGTSAQCIPEHNQDLPQNTKYKTKDNRTKIHDC